MPICIFSWGCVAHHFACTVQSRGHTGLGQMFTFACVEPWNIVQVTDMTLFLLSRLQIKEFSNVFVSDMDNRRYLLKAPHHLLSLQALTDVFPQAQLVFTYRNLSQVIPSFLSLASTFTEQYGGVLDHKWRKR